MKNIYRIMFKMYTSVTIKCSHVNFLKRFRHEKKVKNRIIKKRDRKKTKLKMFFEH